MTRLGSASGTAATTSDECCNLPTETGAAQRPGVLGGQQFSGWLTLWICVVFVWCDLRIQHACGAAGAPIASATGTKVPSSAVKNKVLATKRCIK